MALTSRFEIARDQIINEFAKITIANGYRNNVVRVINALRSFEAITESPEIGIVFPVGQVSGTDGIWTGFDQVKDVVVQGVVSTNTSDTKDNTKLSTAIASLEHDMLRVMAIIVTKYVHGTEYRWNVVPKPFKIMSGIDFGQQENQGIIEIDFQIQLRSTDGTFV